MKGKIQQEAIKAHIEHNCKSIIALSVGMGKTKIAIDRIFSVRESNPSAKILFTGAREVYSINFLSELNKWNCNVKNIDMICNKSLHNYIKHYDLIIYDEAHKETDRVYTELLKIIKINPKVEIIGLTGTPLKDHPIYSILPISYSYLMHNAIEEKMLNNFEMYVLKYDLPQDEKALYNYYYKRYLNAPMVKHYCPELNKLKIFLNNLNSKVEITKKIIENNLKDKKILIYAGSIEQSKLFNLPVFNSSLKKEDKSKIYDTFYKSKKGKLVNVGILKESVSIPNLKCGFVLGIDSSSSSKQQLIGRFLRLTVNDLSKIYFIVAKNTVEEKWVLNGMENFKQIKIINI
jgi:superfamily II DNA or RNA helicase